MKEFVEKRNEAEQIGMTDIEAYVEEVRYMFVRRFHDDQRTIQAASRAAVLAGFGMPADPVEGGLIPATSNILNQSILAGLLTGYFERLGTGEAAVRACFAVLWPTAAPVEVANSVKALTKRKLK
jgi:hypothetical protein